MQWMQFKRPLSSLVWGATLCLSLSTINCYAVIKEQTISTSEKLVQLPPVTISDRMRAKIVQTGQSKQSHDTSHKHMASENHSIVPYETWRQHHRFTDPRPGDPQPAVRHIEPPTPLEHLPSSKVLARQEFSPGYKVMHDFWLRPFTRIVADSDINITLRNSNRPQVAVMNREQPGRDLVITTVKNGTLYLQDAAAPSDARIRDKPLQVLVDANGIDFIRLHKRSSLYAPNYRAHNLKILSFTSGNIILHGSIHSNHIEQHGTGMISMDSINAKKLDIMTNGPGLIRVAGSVDTLTVRGIGNAKVDAKYLRTKDAIIQTTDISEIAVAPYNSLNGFASGNSHIYYYKTPEFIAPRTMGSGNILQMQYWD
ncbi:MAG: DUF2807 domain-containing protein [Gammaproteobacteria bacterium]|nr:DUF2807 domain-containing protein [Gammaproteobacteria bacterium]